MIQGTYPGRQIEFNCGDYMRCLYCPCQPKPMCCNYESASYECELTECSFYCNVVYMSSICMCLYTLQHITQDTQHIPIRSACLYAEYSPHYSNSNATNRVLAHSQCSHMHNTVFVRIYRSRAQIEAGVSASKIEAGTQIEVGSE